MAVPHSQYMVTAPSSTLAFTCLRPDCAVGRGGQRWPLGRAQAPSPLGLPRLLLEKGGDASTCFVCCVDGVGSAHRVPGQGRPGLCQR